MIKIICVGKLKENYLIDGVNDYLNRIRKYHKIDIIQLNDSNINSEGDDILRHIDKKDYLICMDIDGKMMSSVEFASFMNNTFISNSNITFIIGGSDGVRDDIKNMCNYRFSFSKMTFPHGLFRMILLEQIYRCFKINNNESYHK